MNTWLEKNRAIILTLLGLLAGGSALVFALRWQPAPPIIIEPPPPTSTPGLIEVYISGEVVTSGVYSLPPDAILQDALAEAGGPTADADIEHINLAQPLKDGDHVYIPLIGEAPTPAPAGADSPVGGGMVNINTATLEELQTLPGIGPALAQRIIDYREANGPFATIEDIQNVSGIGPTTFEKFKDLITVN